MCLIVCDREISTLRRHRLELGSCATEKKIVLLGANDINTTQLNTLNTAPAACGTHLQYVYCVAAAPPPKPGDSGVAVDVDHERVGAQDLEKVENEDNNAGEKVDGQY